MAKKKGILTKLFGPNSMARQFFVWNVASEFVSTALQPFVTIVSHQVNTAFPVVAASPVELASMVLRNVVGRDWAANEAKKSGIHPNIFDLLVAISGGPPSIEDMLHLMRRGKVSRDDVIRAIQQSNIKSEWIDTILKLGVQPPTPIDILEALLEGQIDRPSAEALFIQLGGDIEFFDLLYNTRGASPTPDQAAEMALRGIIPWTGSGAGVVSFEQSFLEGPWRNKWLAAFRKAAEYIPPPETIGAIYRRGAITVEKAHTLLAQRGVPQDMFAAYLFDDSNTGVIKAKELTESTVSTLFQENAISLDDAKGMLAKLRYQPEEIDFVVTAWQLARDLKYRNAAISTVHSQYVNHKIDRLLASNLLDGFKVPATQRDSLIRLWDQEERAKVSLLTAAQIKSAMRKELLSPDDALQRLVDYGYSEQDAEIYLII
jgi:hypothetical protein